MPQGPSLLFACLRATRETRRPELRHRMVLVALLAPAPPLRGQSVAGLTRLLQGGVQGGLRRARQRRKDGAVAGRATGMRIKGALSCALLPAPCCCLDPRSLRPTALLPTRLQRRLCVGCWAAGLLWQGAAATCCLC